MKNHEDKLLVSRLKNGEEAAYIALVNRYSQQLFVYALGLSKDHAQAQDIIQNVFLKAWEQRKNMEIHTSLKNFLYRFVYNEFINQYKRKRSTKILEETYFRSLEKAVLAQNEPSHQEIIQKISNEIASLPPKCQQVFTLSMREGLTNREIAEYLNISIKTVEAQITKAYKILREKVGKEQQLVFTLIFGEKLPNSVGKPSKGVSLFY
ncbi:RNA polymerase sigma factor [Arenibacter lacus]|uniref:RNA polymerase sigma factor n=1 Tax=Arenibacter lacus TaxID=2608629 RepID=UPI00123E032F|nr:RNA polymerase sigma-70 factor [Arenibacter lacus]